MEAMPLTRLIGPSSLQQRGEVVRPHVEHRPAAGGVVELRRGVPPLVAAAEHVGRKRDGPADRAVVDQFPRGLDARAHEGVGRAADAHAVVRRPLQQRLGVLAVDAQRLLAVGVLARVDRVQRDRHVGGGDREVQDQVNAIIGVQLVHGADLGDAELLGLGAGGGHIEVRAGGHLQDREVGGVLEVLVADVAAADDADAKGFHAGQFTRPGGGSQSAELGHR